jgi:capsular polysaccharide biosynthesis protein
MNLKDLRLPVLRWAMGWPGDSTWMGPPRLPPAKMVEVAAESKNEIPELIPVHPAGQIFRKKPAMPVGCPPHPAFDIPVAPQTPTYLARVPNGRVVGPTVAVLTSADRMLADVSLDWGHPGLEHFAYRRFRLPRCRDFQGSALLLACTGADTYFHWLTDALPRLEIAAKARGLGWRPDFWVVNTLKKTFIRESLIHLGIPKRRIIPLDQEPHVRFSDLWVPSLPCEQSSGDSPAWAVGFLKNCFLRTEKQCGPKKRVWIQRSNLCARHIPLSAEDQSLLKSLDFGVYQLEELSLLDQISLFNEASEIAGPHGAGFTGIVFSKNLKVLEFFNNDYVNACYYALSEILNLNYFYNIVKVSKKNRINCNLQESLLRFV